MTDVDNTPAPNTPAPAAPGLQPLPAENPRTRGHSPARDAREQSQASAERKVSIAGTEYDEKSVADALAERVERQLARDALPRTPDAYEVKLPEGFKAPEGMQFEFRTDDPALEQFRQIAHRRGMDQETFSEALGAFAAVKVAEQQQIDTARQAQLQKLGAAGQQRIDAIETWLKAKVGDKAAIAISTLKQFPIAANVEMFETIIRAFSSQGGTTFTQGGREGEADKSSIPGYENMSFTQARIAQMNQKFGGDR